MHGLSQLHCSISCASDWLDWDVVPASETWWEVQGSIRKGFLFPKKEGTGWGEGEKRKKEARRKEGKKGLSSAGHSYLNVVLRSHCYQGKKRPKDKPLWKDCQKTRVFPPTLGLLVIGDKKSSLSFKQADLGLLFLVAEKFPSINRRGSEQMGRRDARRETINPTGRESSTTHCWCQQARGPLMIWVCVLDQARQATFPGKTQLRTEPGLQPRRSRTNPSVPWLRTK